ncbi:hypothetical protein QCD85_21440 [Paenibacillus sp. PsM32]|uniref:hypothetical protein n=1 Tax=Paenibacillus sp. PsM32 TaxID=3030536 RepID=UPI00263A9FA3|nr:hypothetical protein [Paenibacillus sp. PsM32]MDN4620695.1 hypothetical protein [Paenibacillus sp. PsM32]
MQIANKIGQKLKNHKQLTINLVIMSCFFSLLLGMLVLEYILSYSPPLTDFSNHVMSMASASNVDIKKRIDLYYLVVFGFVIVFLFVFLLLFRLCSNKMLLLTKEHFNFLNNVSLIGIASVGANFLTEGLDFAVYILAGVLLLFCISINDKTSFLKERLIYLNVYSMCLSIPVGLYFWSIFRDAVIFKEISQWDLILKLGINSSVVLFIVIWFIVAVFIIFWSQKRLMNEVTPQINTLEVKEKQMIVAAMPILFSPIIQSLLLEVNNTINVRWNLVFYEPKIGYTIVMLFSITFFVWVLKTSILNNRIMRFQKININFFLPIILAGFSFMLTQPYKKAPVANEFFEMANHGLSVDHLFRFGKIPLVETFDAHMLASQLFAYVYSIFNGYEPWAAFLYNPYIKIIYMLILYFLLKNMIGKINSFFFLLVFPLLDSLFNEAFLLAGLIPLLIIRIFKSGIKVDTKFWVVVVLICLYRLDFGVAATGGGVLACILIFLMRKEYKKIFIFIAKGALAATGVGLIFVVLCLFKSINPITRLVEILSLVQSNQNWAYNNNGDSTTIAYAIGYYIAPIIVLLISLYIVVTFLFYQRNSEKHSLINNNFNLNNNLMVYIVFFCGFYYFNLSRGIVRHSLLEGSLAPTLSTFSYILLSFIALKSRNHNRLRNFLGMSILLAVVININVSSFSADASFMSRSLQSQNYEQQYNDNNHFNHTRVTGTMPKDASLLKEILDLTLKPDETYFDFSSSNYFYALVGRENPIYANQSPLILNGDRSQDLALEELKTKKVKYALIPRWGQERSTIDGLAIDYKYYKLSEYVYENYVPFIHLESFDIYVLKDDKNYFFEILKTNHVLKEILYSKPINSLELKQENLHNLRIVNRDASGVTFQKSGDDPNITDVLNQSSWRQQIANKSDSNVTLKLSYKNSTTGSIRIYYKFGEDQEFTEENAQQFDLKEGASSSIQVEFSKIPSDVRIDIDTNQIELENIEVARGVEVISTQEDIWFRELGLIPQLWAELDKENVYSHLPQLIKPKQGNNIDIPVHNTKIFKQPLYLIIQASSETPQKAYINLNKKDKVLMGQFSFDISEGTHLYAVRLSTDYKWWNGQIKDIQFSTKGNLVLFKLGYYLPKDGKFQSLD